ncbi:AMP-binding protein [Roseibium sediminicola]|uniref:AMP-binding protein n=1 Tax=Roseibium sediminicola TaxID=2933272 RepID=A0ABT0GP03_9HYPH|nr:AMP-binding protein [Roseibium sp. CAU 1639]MCK7611176.1 AMP-binding protein [Roseibium sp. CAU 1639]
MNLIQDFLSEAQRQPEHIAIIDKAGASISYGDLERYSGGLAATFAQKGVGKGDRVLIGLFPGLDLYAGLAALWRLGAVAVFPEPAMGLAGFRHAARATRPKGLLTGMAIGLLGRILPETRRIPVRLSAKAARVGQVEGCEVLQPEDPALISFTSGSTGLPKAIERSHGLMRAQHEALAPLIASDKEEIDIVAFPAFVLTCIGHGTTAVMPNWNLRRHDRMKPEVLTRLAEKTGATRLLVPPVTVTRLLAADLPKSVHRVMTGGGPLYPDVARKFLAAHPGVGLTNVYGSTEAEPIAHAHLESLSEADWQAAATGQGLPAGTPVREATLRFVDDEILVSGPHVNRGYLDPARNAETKLIEGDIVWHRTGDAGRLDEAGRLWLLGRHGAAQDRLFGFSVETAARLWPGVTGAAFTVDGRGMPVLFLSGDSSRIQDWRQSAEALGAVEVLYADSIPMDRRHRSKPDTRRLLQRFGRE